jgi:hypothetical protein
MIGDVDEDLANLRQLRPQPRVELVHRAGELARAQAPIDMELAHVVTIDESGKTLRIEEYPERPDGLEAAGLQE